MNIGYISCLIMSVFFAILGLVFLILKGKGAILISGFNALPKAERDKYDTVRMSKDQQNRFFIWAMLLAVGAVASWFISQYLALVAFALWLLMFIKDIQMDVEKAFSTYKRE